MSSLFSSPDVPDPNARPAPLTPEQALASGRVDANYIAQQQADAAAADERRRRLGQGRASTILVGQNDREGPRQLSPFQRAPRAASVLGEAGPPPNNTPGYDGNGGGG